MSDVKWIKIVTNIFDNRKIKQIEIMPDGDTILVIWFKLICLAATGFDNVKNRTKNPAEEEIAKLEAELAHQQKFLAGVRAKLSNERFVANAPEAVVAIERKKESDSLSKIESLTAAINALKNN